MFSDMERYIGSKVLLAIPMSRGEYNAYRGWDVPLDENPQDQGYFVEYEDGGKPNHPDHIGYISWSPKDVFEKAYVKLDTIDNSPETLMKYFKYDHLPPALQAVSKPFCELALRLVSTTPYCAERTVALRKLLEAKDCAVRARLP